MMIKTQFPDIGGLQNTLLQNSKSLRPFTGQKNLQVAHEKMGHTDHWVVISM